jgi:acetaldehyde dehydrogenase (acetylating)
VVVNSPSPHGSIGLSTNLFPAMTLGCGAVGGNISSDNISPLHLINLRRVAYEARPATSSLAAAPPCAGKAAGTPCSCPTAQSLAPQESPPAPEPLALDQRQAVARAIERFLASRKPGAEAPATASQNPVAAQPQPKPEPAPYKLKPRPVEFVSVSDVRTAVQRKEKLLVGPKTIITPAARDLAGEYDVLVTTDE